MNPTTPLHLISRARARVLAAGVAVGAVAFVVAPSTQATAAKVKAPKIACAWARQSPMMASMGAAYMKITTSTNDRLVSASAPASVSKMVQIHEMVPAPTTTMAMGATTTMAMGATTTMAMGASTMAGHDHEHMSSTTMAMSGGTMAPMMVMQEVKGGLVLSANKAVELKPGGYHIMFMELVGPLKVGQKIPVTLKFEKYGTLKVTVPVAADQPSCK